MTTYTSITTQSGSPLHNTAGALGALCVSYFMTAVDNSVVNVAVPAIQQSFDAPLTDVAWVYSAYLLSYAVLLIVGGRLGDRFGPKRVLLTGLMVFTAASLGCALAPSAAILIAARAIQGVGAALITPQTISLIVHMFPPSRRGSALGVWAAAGGVAMAAGPLLGGVLLGAFGWRAIFLINVPIAIAGWIAAARMIPDYRPQRIPRFDLLGVVLSGVGLFALTFAIQDCSVAFAVVGVCCMTLFVLWQRANPSEPLLPLRLFTDRNFSAATLAVFGVGVAMAGLFLPLMVYLQSGLGYSALQAGAVTVPMCVMAAWSGRRAGQASDKFHPASVAGAGFALLAVGFAALLFVLHPGTSVWLLSAPLVVAGVGVGTMSAPLPSIGTRTVPTDLIGAASGVFNTARQLGAAVGAAAAAAVLHAGIDSSPTTAMQVALVFPLVMLIVGTGCCALMRVNSR